MIKLDPIVIYIEAIDSVDLSAAVRHRVTSCLTLPWEAAEFAE